MRYLVPITMLVLSLAIIKPVEAQSFKPEFKAGYAAFQKSDYATALKHFRPLAKHAQQVAFYADVTGCKASLIYASENGYRVFDETNCEELTPEGIENGVGEARARAWSRENLMRLAPSSITLMQMLSPDWSDSGWKMATEHREEARKVWGLAASN